MRELSANSWIGRKAEETQDTARKPKVYIQYGVSPNLHTGGTVRAIYANSRTSCLFP